MSTATVHTTASFGMPTSSTHLRLTRRGRVVLTTLVSVPLVVGSLFLVANAGEAAATAPTVASTHAHFHYVTVQDGQSLWSIAERVAPNADPREVIAEIVSLNQLQSGDVVPGERLAIPLQYEAATR
jgi:LysM repeat protein